MLNIRNVLVPNDHSPLDEVVSSYALDLADRLDCHIHQLHVTHTAKRRKSLTRSVVTTADSTAGSPKGLAHDNLVEEEVSAASVPRAIIEYAEEHAIDLIVMGGRGSSGLAIRRLGGVAAPVVRYAPCSVMTVRDAFPEHGVRRIVVPIDFSESSRMQLTTARELAAAYGAEIDLLTVLEQIMYPSSFGIAPLIGLEREMSRRWEERLAMFWDETDGPDVPYRPHLRAGPAASEIINFTLQEASDMVIIATHGKTGLRRLMLGSVAAHVIQRSLCATLTVKTFGRPLSVTRQTATLATEPPVV